MDFGIVIEGEVELELDDGSSTLLRAGIYFTFVRANELKLGRRYLRPQRWQSSMENLSREVC